MPEYFDDNFGHWNQEDDPEEIAEFYDYCVENSVEKKCKGCGRKVRILPHYAYCDRCASQIEQGMDVACYDEADEED